MQRKSKGKITIPADLNIWDHELRTAQVLAHYGCNVQFLSKEQGQRIKTADVLVNKEAYEIKSPKADKLSAVERNLKRACKQSCNVILDSRRMSKVPDATIQKFLIEKLRRQKSIKKLLFVNRKHELIDISTLY